MGANTGAASTAMGNYLHSIENATRQAYEIAGKARALGLDPELNVDIPLAENMAERVVGLVSLTIPNLKKQDIIARIDELEKEYEFLDWRVGLKLAEEVALQKFCKFTNKEQAVEAGIRFGFAYLTLGIVSAPLEGFIGVKIKKRRDEGEYLAVLYAGPVRGAGGTAAATSVILADYVRTIMGIGAYDPTDDEIHRFMTEIHDYHERITNLQYHPTDEELNFLVRNIPVEISGDPTERIEVSNYKDLPRVETNRIRGGICLVLAEGVAQKAPKLWKRLGSWGHSFGLNWEFLSTFLNMQKLIKSQLTTSDTGNELQITPNYTYISDLVAGRPILSHPMRSGGFRLRYGRLRTSGFSAAGINPVTLRMFNRYIATGTQIKVERPGKAATIAPCDSIEGPIVRLRDGSVVRLTKQNESLYPSNEIDEVLYLGDILFSYGDFSENGHKLVPAGYCEEWWIQELEKSIVDRFGSLDVEKLGMHTEIPINKLIPILENPLEIHPSFKISQILSECLNIPIHPRFTYYWNGINSEDLIYLFKWVSNARTETDNLTIRKIIIPFDQNTQRSKRTLELLGVPHKVVASEFAVIEGDDARCFSMCIGLNKPNFKMDSNADNVLDIINNISPFKIMDKAGTFIGARMGRPEKAKMRKLLGSPHILFPVGQQGDRLRSFQSALQAGFVSAELPIRNCNHCKRKTIYTSCDDCGKITNQLYFCTSCGENGEDRCSHGEKKQYSDQSIKIGEYFESAVNKLKIKTYPDLIKGVRGTANKNHVVEHLAKGILRAKHGIYVNKDGTTRYDMTELPLTHFMPKEIGTSVEKLRQLGYLVDVDGKDLKNSNQIVELKPQDLILPSNENSLDESSNKVLSRVAHFLDELLEKFYGLEPFYKIEQENDLIGHLVVGLAPHISAGLVGRIIGFSDTQGCYAHPLWHAGLRRDCDGDECCVMLLLDALINFSRQFLPNQRGAKTMDSPLVLTARLVPSEVDDQSHGLDVSWRYPLQLYESALNFGNPWDVKVDQIRSRLTTERQYEGFGYTHPVSNINIGIKCSAYKTLPTMAEKLQGQMEIASKIRAVDIEDVARLVIEKHFIRDIKGNLRQFSMQKFRCVKCNEKFRRPPLIGKCTTCSGNLLFTVSEGSIIKYLEPSLSLARQYDLPPYLVQSLEITKRRVESLFGRAKEKQSALESWVANKN
jgi:DNA polymerase II large subunit